jgi:D-alanyl-D-alanine dipeptidase
MGTIFALIIIIVVSQSTYPVDDCDFIPDTPIGISYPEHGGSLELPVNGATGWAAVSMPLRSAPYQGAEDIFQLAPGQGFIINAEYGNWWNVSLGGAYDITGWLLHHECFINLPDVVPSLAFNITNAYSSMKRSSGYEIPNITGYALYDAQAFNHRLNRYEFIVPVLYATSKRIFEAQQAALADGNTIIIYEAFRPHAAQQSVVRNLRVLMDSNPAVQRAINTPPWNMSWFIATGTSTHQRGAAIDAGLGRILSSETVISGVYVYLYITAFEEFPMPTPIHELSPSAAAFIRPVSSSSPDAWKTVPFTNTMTEGAILLHGYLTGAGFTPLASEWWHFNDLENTAVAIDLGITGEFFINRTYSRPPGFN